MLGLEVRSSSPECQVSLGLDPDDDMPAVVTAGVEHLVPLIRDLTIPDEL